MDPTLFFDTTYDNGHHPEEECDDFTRPCREDPDAIADTVLDEGAVVLRDDRRQTQVLEPEPDLQPRLPAWPMLRRKQKRKKAVKVQ